LKPYPGQAGIRPTKAPPTVDDEIARCVDDPDRFNSVVLARRYKDEHGVERPSYYWSRQREICRSIVKYRTTAVPTGNGVGKSFLAAGVLAWFASTRPQCKVVVCAPTQAQLSGVLWSELAAAISSAATRGVPLGGRFRPLEWDLGDNWRVEGWGSGSTESKSGRHAGELFAIIDEASGVPQAVLEAIDSLNPSRILYLGNPLRPEAKFYEVCTQSADNPHVNVITIPSTESPDILLERSPRGMADRTWLETSRFEYGEESIWWLSHVLAKFPGETTEALLPREWLDLAARTIHVDKGDRWISVDVGEGVGGDDSVIVVRDDNGIVRDGDGLGFEASNRYTLETLAERVRVMSDRFHVKPTHIVYDQNGIGADVDGRLRAVGLEGCRGFKGSRDGGDKFANLRSAFAWALRRRMDPLRPIAGPAPPGKRIMVPQQPYALPAELVKRYRPELHGMQYSNTGKGEIALENKEVFVKRLKHSPNFFDALAMSYAYPNG
jgi:hypothetical protein